MCNRIEGRTGLLQIETTDKEEIINNAEYRKTEYKEGMCLLLTN
jgi:hypothetical protein